MHVNADWHTTVSRPSGLFVRSTYDSSDRMGMSCMAFLCVCTAEQSRCIKLTTELFHFCVAVPSAACQIGAACNSCLAPLWPALAAIPSHTALLTRHQHQCKSSITSHTGLLTGHHHQCKSSITSDTALRTRHQCHLKPSSKHFSSDCHHK